MFDTPIVPARAMSTIMERINVHLAVRQINALDVISNQSGLKRSEVIRRAIDEYIDRVPVYDEDSISSNHRGYTGVWGVRDERQTA